MHAFPGRRVLHQNHTVSGGPHCLRLAGVISLLFVSFLSPFARAQSPQSTTSGVPETWGDSYRLPLAFAYVAPVVLTGAAGLALSSGAVSKEVGVPGLTLGAASMFALPPVMHGIHRNGNRATRAVFGSIGGILGGALIGAFVAPLAGGCSDTTDISFCRFGRAAFGAVVGAGVGYLTWGAIDTFAFTNRRRIVSDPAPRTRRAFSAFVPTVTPLVSTISPGRSVGFDGVAIEAAVAF
jgi:hypothetical protein